MNVSTKKRCKTGGFSLTEMLISVSIFTVVSLLAYIVLSSSTEASRVAETQAQLQANLRDVMQAVSSELRTAYSERTIAPRNQGEKSAISNEPGGLPVGTIPLTIAADGRSVQFQRPTPSNTSPVPMPSSVITIALQSEDAGFVTGNAKLDATEDANGDQMLNRRVVRTQGGTTLPLASVNDIADLRFTLMNSQDPLDLNRGTVLVRITASRHLASKYSGSGAEQRRLVTVDLESRVKLEN